MICKECGKTEPESRWNERFGKHELCEKCLRDHEHFKSKYISYVCKQARIKNSYGYLTVKASLIDSHEIITIVEERLIDRMNFAMLIKDLEDALQDDVLPDPPFGSRVVSFTFTKRKYNDKKISLRNSEITNVIRVFYNAAAIMRIEYSDYPKEMRL